MKIYKIIAPLLCAGLLITSASAQSTEGWLEPTGAEVQTVTVKRQDFINTELYYGTVKSAVYELAFEISGTVDECNISLGDQVGKYMILASLDQSSLEAKVDAVINKIEILENKQALALEIFDAETKTMENSRDQYNNMIANGTAGNYEKMQAELLELKLELHQKERSNIVAKQKAAMGTLESEYDQANQNISKNIIYSPSEGEIIYCKIAEGLDVKANDYVVVIKNTGETLIAVSGVSITAEKVANYDKFLAYIDGVPREVTINLNPGKGFVSELTYFNIPEGIDISSVKDVLIEMISGTEEGVLTIPSCTIYKNGDQRYVYRMKDGIKEMVEILVGNSNGTEVVVTGGDLKEGDEIYVP